MKLREGAHGSASTARAISDAERRDVVLTYMVSIDKDSARRVWQPTSMSIIPTERPALQRKPSIVGVLNRIIAR
jgi:hypothetical protein